VNITKNLGKGSCLKSGKKLYLNPELCFPKAGFHSCFKAALQDARWIWAWIHTSELPSACSWEDIGDMGDGELEVQSQVLSRPAQTAPSRSLWFLPHAS
jgi:hypothetical protein